MKQGLMQCIEDTVDNGQNPQIGRTWSNLMNCRCHGQVAPCPNTGLPYHGNVRGLTDWLICAGSAPPV